MLDLATIFGAIVGIGIILAAILLGNDPGSFINLPSVLIVLGGTMAVVIMRYTFKQFFASLKAMFIVFFYRSTSPVDLIEELGEYADLARRQGLLALEGQEITHPALQQAVLLMVDGHELEHIKRSLVTNLNQSIERHRIGQSVFKRMGDVAPAIGMVGTLIGLVQMLGNMSDPKTIGPAMAVALLTTLYGALIANLIALPIADKLNMRMNEERRNKFIILDGVECISEGVSSMFLKEYLGNYLPRDLHEKVKDNG